MAKKHDLYKCQCDGERFCVYCDGGLASCNICHGGEATLPTECPGRAMTAEEMDAVMNRGLDFVGGKWRTPK